MIDINELRPAVEVAGLNAISMQEVLELLDRLEAAEKERDDVAQQLVQSEQGKRKISEECDALRAKIERMEQPESGFRERCTPAAPAGGSNRFPLYALPGAKGE